MIHSSEEHEYDVGRCGDIHIAMTEDSEDREDNVTIGHISLVSIIHF